MSPTTTPAILLRAHPFSESSKVLRFYTRVLGLVGVMARGVRRGASKARGALGTFSEGVAVIAVRDTRELQSLREFTPKKARIGLAADLQRLAGASLAAELVLWHADQEPHPGLYDLLSRGLDRLEAATPNALAAEALALGWSIVQVFGFGPELSACTGCGRTLESDEMARFDLDAGGVRCPSCHAPEGSRRIGPGARAQVARFLQGDASAVPLADARPTDNAPAEAPAAPAHLSLLDDFVTFHLLDGRRPDSFRFLRSATHPVASDRPASDRPTASDRPAAAHPVAASRHVPDQP